MNEVIQNILTRRSVRSFKEEQISDENLNILLEVAKYAPSGMGRQGWHFTVVQNKDKMEKLISIIKEQMLNSSEERFKKMGGNPDFNPFYNAPTVIITAYDKTAATIEADCAVALENIFLAAHSLHISSCWIHILAYFGNDPKVRSVLTEFGVPEDYVVSGSAVLGYNNNPLPDAAPRKEGIVNIVK
ncbi:MAG: nitroreductase [Herbinix sp.]|jgi:nitroreductase|nr:nitroreductase [Herbinix sp.]